MNLFNLLGQGEDAEAALPRPKQPKKAQGRQEQVHRGGAAYARNLTIAGPDAAGGSGGAPAHAGPQSSRLFEFYRAFQKVFADPASGDVVLRFHRTDVVRIRRSGDVILNTGGNYTHTTLASMNDALRVIGMELEPGSGGGHSGNWTLRFNDGSSCAYRDNMLLQAHSAADAGRGRAVYEAYCGGPAPAVVGPAAPQQQQQQQHPRAAAVPPAGARLAQQQQPARAAATGVAGPAAYAAQHHQQAVQRPEHPHHHAGAAHGAGGSGKGDIHQQLAAAARQAGMHDDDDLDDDDACVICLAAARDTVLVPCGHVVLCQNCCADVMASTSECPVCRVPVAESIQMG